ncbi:MAG: hypothetical protein O7C59_00625 [Rickettsia endosymbiont of Ixodes persulcatus]|nr:hypothetical protein [Rickettsia endosymbiont of Ixodes persulcatus]MCZ6911013.1 hypothetical protein [Rickettsia endosymbiont of Ixodes persulcatus]MCZ6913165.1 hypothetical protein [Rickettsia endosymbiont of Ixodes persulcatus]
MTKTSKNDIIGVEKILKSQLNTETGEEIIGSIAHYWENKVSKKVYISVK